MQNTNPKDTFLTSIYLYNPASLAGRKTFLDYGYFNWSLGYDESIRRRSLSTLFAHNNIDLVCQSLVDHHIDHVLIAPNNHQIAGKEVQQSVIAKKFRPAYISNQRYHIYDVSKNCPTST